MKKILYEYKDKIIKLLIRDKYNKDEILINDFFIEREKNIEIYYFFYNEYINIKVKIFIVGIIFGF